VTQQENNEKNVNHQTDVEGGNADDILDEQAPEINEISDETLTDQQREDLENTKKELEEVQDRYLRLQAELQNIRKRSQKEKEDAARFRSQSLATQLLPVIDNLERAMTIEVTDQQGENLKKGIEMVLSSFEEALTKEGITVIDPAGEPFDPQYHEAYTAVPADGEQESGTIAQVFEKGYTLHGRVLRAAKVAVVQ